MSLLSLPFRLLSLMLMAGAVSILWLYRRDVVRLVRPEVVRVFESLEAPPGGQAGPTALARARGKVDSLNGWSADSVMLTLPEMASLLADALPRQVVQHLDSVALAVEGDGSVRVSARLETATIPRDLLGPLEGALDPWERIAATGQVATMAPGEGVWQIRTITLRGLTLTPEMSRRFLAAALPGVREGRIRFPLPAGVGGVSIRQGGATLYRQEGR